MPQLESVSRYQGTKGVGCGIFMFCFGLVFVVMGLYSLLFTGILQAGFWSFAFGGLFAVLFGGMIAWGGISQVNQASRFGRPNAEITASVLRPGESYTFLYQQSIRRGTNIRFIGVFLVFRERVSYYDGSETRTRDVDRLVQKFVHPGRYYSAGETLREEHTLRVPIVEMGIRNAYMGHKEAKVETLWVVKVRLHLGNGYDVWEEYKLDLADRLAPVPLDAADKLENRFDVWLVESSLKSTMRMAQVKDNVLSHLDAGQIGDCCDARPSILLERLTSMEAQEAKAKLEATGAVVAVKPFAAP